MTQRGSTVRIGDDESGSDSVTVVVRVAKSEFDQPMPAETPALGCAMLARACFDLLLETLSAAMNLETDATRFQCWC